MYFNENKENTNIDSEFNTKNKFDFSKYKKLLIIAGAIILFIIIIIIIMSLNKGKKSYTITLNGDEEITIYQGATYNEPGYNAFDNKKNNLNSQVKIRNNLDSESIGTYTIIYSLHNVSVNRTINVIERPEIITAIHLNGDKNMTIKVDEEFSDPGCTAIDALDGDLTHKVTVTGSVDTSKEGIYNIIYSVVNSEGVTTSETRTVTVE